MEVRTLEAFFARHTTTTDPYDQEAQRIRPRYEALAALLAGRLRDIRVYRIGKIEVSCYVAGIAAGYLAGLKTIAIET